MDRDMTFLGILKRAVRRSAIGMYAVPPTPLAAPVKPKPEQLRLLEEPPAAPQPPEGRA